ncbi:NUDIX domain-containing protein [Clostridium botulinum]|uniref:NUDIX hydrolase n=1 Tax=Clostridium botulinum TaxID=1491 RepID=UPI0003754F70|nr:NUDIX hydrolase [Clostridium botulinum]MBN1035460.1 NUDIX domain-containing protein [Clostridium botulinum]NFE74059.1 NUDIX domain-containing protein [Clostridium botulinum]NFL59082.1 NUDIX domain-containing protein [Clostridium botulinum]NFL62379.1 NUDIX domain-containing protein [Clostridium botulinum]NFO57667.1 NUDIX domain-containing protein [Clostridium botulinum]
MTWIKEIEDYNPYNEQEVADKKFILDCIKQYDNLLTRENLLAHMTSSGYIVNKNRDKVLMIHHNIYNTWAWTGGHTDGDSDFLHVAIKEAQEETGVKYFNIVTSEILSLDVLPVKGHFKKGNYISAHLHLSVAYVLECDENEELIIKKDENSGVKWIPVNEIHLYSNEPDMIELYSKFNEKIKKLY